MLDLERIRRTLTSALVSDVLDGLGACQRAMRPFVRPLDDALLLVGHARTGLYMPVYAATAGDDPYALEMALVDDLKPGEVAVLACDGPTERIAPWGELLSTAARARGAAGCVTDGLVRDVCQIRAMGFPVFAGGIGPLDTRGRAQMMAMDVAVEVAGVRVEPGDLVLGDVDGVVVVPRALAAAALDAALVKAEAEDRTREELAAGGRLTDVFARHGVL